MSDSSVWSGTGSKFEKHIYYRRPKTDDRGQPAENAGWITIQGNNLDRMRDLMLRGFQPLSQYGTQEDWVRKQVQAGRMAANEPLDSPWRPILEHPDGPAEFPVEQILVSRWYKDVDCPVPGTKFPQLGGSKVVEIRCPECNRPPFQVIDGMGGVEPLARHLRLIHSWDRTSLTRYGERVNIDFDAIYSNVKSEYEFGGAKKAERKSSGFDCPDCDWTPKANAKRPAQALALHAKEHQFTVVTA